MKKIRQTMARKKKQKIIRDKLKDNNERHLDTLWSRRKRWNKKRSMMKKQLKTE